MGIDTLLDIIALVIRETQIAVDTNSDKMILDILDMYASKGQKWKRGDGGLIKRLSAMVKELIELRSNGEELDLKSIHRRLTILLTRDDELSDSDDGDAISEVIDIILIKTDDLDEVALDVKRLKSSIANVYSKEKVRQVSSQMNMEISKNEIENGDVYGFIEKNITRLEEIKANSNKADEAILGEIDLGSDKDLANIEDSVVHKHVFKTGCRAANRMLQGGHRTSEMCTVAARTHNYKTGWSLTSFVGMLLNNKPRKTKDGIKPLVIWLSFEDELINIVDSIYSILYMTDKGEDPDLSTISLSGRVNAVRDRLQETGFHVKILRVNPTEWSYKDIFNKLSIYTSKGFETQILVIDYLDKLPTTGLYVGGAMGTEKKDLVKRVKNHASALDIVCISPWQLSPAANGLMKDGMSQKDFLPYIHDKGYYQGSSTLSTEIDLEIFTNKVSIGNGRYALHVHLGKHKIASVLNNEADKSFFLPFPKQGSIPLDVFMDKDISSPNLEGLRGDSEDKDTPF